MAYPTLTLEIAFTTDPFATPTWTDVSAYMLEGSVNRGRGNELDRFPAGTASFRMDNSDRRFDPTYTAGPYYPNVLPMRRIRLRATRNAVTYDVFNGFIEGYAQEFSHPASATVQITAIDGMSVLQRMAAGSSPFEQEVRTDATGTTTLEHWWRLNESSGAVAVDSADAEDGSYTGTFTLGVDSLVGFDAETTSVRFQAGAGISWAVSEPLGDAFSVEFWINADPTSTVTIGFGEQMVVCTATDVTLALSYASSADARAAVGVCDDTTHHVVITATSGGSRTVKIYVDGVDMAVTNPVFTPTGVLGVTVTGGPAVLDEIVKYAGVLSPARVLAHYEGGSLGWEGDTSGARIGRMLDAANWPAADRDIDTGASTLQGNNSAINSLLDHIQTVELSEAGRFFVTGGGVARFIDRTALRAEDPYRLSNATFGDGTGELHFEDVTFSYDYRLIRNEIRTSSQGQTTQVAEDETSKSTYLRSTYQLSGLLNNSVDELRNYGQYLLDRYKDPHERVTSMRIKPVDVDDLWVQVLERDLVERVTVLRRPQGIGDPKEQQSHIEGINHQFASGRKEWVTNWNLSPAEAPAWIWGVSTWDDPVATWVAVSW